MADRKCNFRAAMNLGCLVKKYRNAPAQWSALTVTEPFQSSQAFTDLVSFQQIILVKLASVVLFHNIKEFL